MSKTTNRPTFRGNGCDVRATAAMLRHFFALDAEVGKALAAFHRKHRKSKSARAACSVWRSHRDFACLCAAEKGEGREIRVYIAKTVTNDLAPGPIRPLRRAR